MFSSKKISHSNFATKSHTNSGCYFMLEISLLTQPLSKCEKIVEMGKKLNFSETQSTRISLTQQGGFLIFDISNFPI